MDSASFLNSHFFTYFVIPFLIFLARICDVSLGTIRIISVSRGIRVLAAVLGFFEVLIWLIAITQIMKNLTNPINYVAYAAGFAMGNFVGISIERKLAMGNLIVRVITQKDAAKLISSLVGGGFGVTRVDAKGMNGPVEVIYVVVRRKDTKRVIRMVERHNPNAFYIIEDVRLVQEYPCRPTSPRSDKGTRI